MYRKDIQANYGFPKQIERLNYESICEQKTR